MRYILREAALADLEAIWLYTSNEWSVDQADHYVRALLEPVSGLRKISCWESSVTILKWFTGIFRKVCI